MSPSSLVKSTNCFKNLTSQTIEFDNPHDIFTSSLSLEVTLEAGSWRLVDLAWRSDDDYTKLRILKKVKPINLIPHMTYLSHLYFQRPPYLARSQQPQLEVIQRSDEVGNRWVWRGQVSQPQNSPRFGFLGGVSGFGFWDLTPDQVWGPITQNH